MSYYTHRGLFVAVFNECTQTAVVATTVFYRYYIIYSVVFQLNSSAVCLCSVSLGRFRPHSSVREELGGLALTKFQRLVNPLPPPFPSFSVHTIFYLCDTITSFDGHGTYSKTFLNCTSSIVTDTNTAYKLKIICIISKTNIIYIWSLKYINHLHK